MYFSKIRDHFNVLIYGRKLVEAYLDYDDTPIKIDISNVNYENQKLLKGIKIERTYLHFRPAKFGCKTRDGVGRMAVILSKKGLFSTKNLQFTDNINDYYAEMNSTGKMKNRLTSLAFGVTINRDAAEKWYTSRTRLYDIFYNVFWSVIGIGLSAISLKLLAFI